MTTHGYSGRNYDRAVDAAQHNTSTLHKMKETYWTTKQAVMQKLGKKEDEHIVASDSELDTKLEVFRAIQRSSMDLLRVIERYQDRLCVVSQEENAMGRFLKTHSGRDKTRAGKMMAAVGKSQSFAAQQRLALRVPLVRLYQEVETFRYRAISDTLVTINRMEGARTEYRGALLWMKNVSEELDPDTYKQLEKFRKVQGQVRKTKARFDKLKLDVMQKVDLLAASRCNMFSHVLANYQSTLLHFWEKTSRTMSAVAESFKGYQHYEFNMLKELQEPSKSTTDTNSTDEDQKENDGFDAENASSSSDELFGSEDGGEGEREVWSLEEVNLQRPPSSGQTPPPTKHVYDLTEVDRLLALDDEYRDEVEDTAPHKLSNMTHSDENNKDTTGRTKNDFTPFIDLGEKDDFSGKLLDREDTKLLSKNGQTDLLTDDLEQNDADKDDMTLLNEILNAPSTGEDEFTQEWQSVFGSGGTPLHTSTPGGAEQEPAQFMPSSLLDISAQMSTMDIAQDPLNPMSGLKHSGGEAGAPQQSAAKSKAQQQPAAKKGQKTDMSSWFNLFADLDPLSDPDAIGQQDLNQNNAA